MGILREGQYGIGFVQGPSMLQIHWDSFSPRGPDDGVALNSTKLPLCFYVPGLGLSWFGTPVSKIHQTHMEVKKCSTKATVPSIGAI